MELSLGVELDLDLEDLMLDERLDFDLEVEHDLGLTERDERLSESGLLRRWRWVLPSLALPSESFEYSNLPVVCLPMWLNERRPISFVLNFCPL